MINIQYIEGTNLAYCNGLPFRKDKKTGYWLCSSINKRLHRYVWEQINGEIPKGYQIHHIDFNKDNNDISNLQLVSSSEHHKIHSDALTDDERELRRKRMQEVVIPAAANWHKSNYDRCDYSKLGKLGNACREEKVFTCDCCGIEFTSKNTKSRFCSNACKSRFHRKNKTFYKKDVRFCVICGTKFETDIKSKKCTCSEDCHMELVHRNSREKMINNHFSRKVEQYSPYGELLKTYNSIKEAKEETGASNIVACCNGSQKQSGGFCWKYVE